MDKEERRELINKLYDAKIPVEEGLPFGLYCVEEVEPGTVVVTKEPFSGPGPCIMFVKLGAVYPAPLPGYSDEEIPGGCMPTRETMKCSDVDVFYVQRMLKFISTPNAIQAHLK